MCFIIVPLLSLIIVSILLMIYYIIWVEADYIFSKNNNYMFVNMFLWKHLPLKKDSPYFNYFLHKIIAFLLPFWYLPYRFYKKMCSFFKFFRKSNIENIVKNNTMDRMT